MNVRKKAFTEFERSFLLNLVQQYSNIIENKKTDGVTSSKKNEAWNRITDEFNASSRISQKANTKQLKKLWINFKAKARDAKTRENQQSFTGGGPAIPDMDSEDSQVLSSIPKVLPTINVLDCDAANGKSDDDDGIFWRHKENRDDLVEVIQEIVVEDSVTQVMPSNNIQFLDDVVVHPPINHNIPSTSQAHSYCVPETRQTRQPRRRRVTENSVEDVKRQILEQDLLHRQQKFELEFNHQKMLNGIELNNKKIMSELQKEELELKIKILKKQLNE